MGIHRGFPTLSQDDVRISKPGRVGIPANATARLNAQHERLTGAAPPGESSRVFQYHDHVKAGGAVLGRGTIFSLDVGQVGNGSYFRHTLLSASAWESMLGSSNREYLFRAFPTPGLTGTLACVFVVRTYGAAVDIRVSNLTTGTQSSHATSAASSNAWQGALTEVPFTAGEENKFDIEIRGSISDALDLLGFCLYEDTNTHPSTSGSTTYSSL